jgi:hypothetical protein
MQRVEIDLYPSDCAVTSHDNAALGLVHSYHLHAS